MAKLGDRVQETTTTTGIGQLTLGGAVTGYVTFNSTFSNGDIVWYVIDNGSGDWEIGSGTVGTGTLTRSVFQSSNANALVPFTAGTKRVFCTAPYTYFLPDMTGNTGKYLTNDGSVASWADNPLGTVTSVSVVSTNGFAGTVANATTTPAITMTTTVTGIVKGNGTAVSAATAGTDYLAPPSGTAILKANSGGALANAVSGTDYAPATSGTSILKGNGAGGFSNAASGTDYAPATSGTSILKGNGSGGFSSAVGNTDYLSVNNPIATGVWKINGSSSGYVGFQAAAAAGTVTYTLPSADGTSGQLLSTNGSGTLSWATSSGVSTGKAIAMAMIFGY